MIAVAATAAALICIRAGRDAVLINRRGVEALPMAFFWAQVGLTVAGYVHLAAIRRWGARGVRVVAFLIAAAVFTAFVPFVDAGHQRAMSLLFTLVPVFFAGLFSSAWLLGGELFEGASGAEVRHGFTRIALGGMIGGTSGGLLARVIAQAFSPRVVVASGVALLMGAALVCWRAHQLVRPISAAAPAAGPTPAAVATTAGSAREAGSGWLRQPYLLTLFGISALSQIATMLVEYQFYVAAARSGGADARFFANFYATVGLASVALHLVVGSRVQSRLGIGGALLVLPIWVLGGTAMVSLATAVVAQSVFRLGEVGLRSTIHQTNWEQVFLPLERERRAVLKMIVDGIVARIATGAAAIALHLLAGAGSPLVVAGRLQGIVSVLLAATGASWIYFTSRLRKLSCAPLGAAGEEPDHLLRLPDS